MRKYKLFYGLLSISLPWKNAYIPIFEGVPFQLEFQQINNEKGKEKMVKQMNPISRDNGFTENSHGLIENVAEENNKNRNAPKAFLDAFLLYSH